MAVDISTGAHRLAGSSPQWARAPTPIVVYHLASLLCHHPDKVFVSVILRGLNEGFPIGFDSARCSSRSVARDHPSSLCYSNIVTQYIAHKVSLGRLVGPVSPLGVPTIPIGLIPKRHEPNSWRMIVDLSCPSGSSVNDGTDPLLASIHYASVDNAVKIICSLGPGALLTSKMHTDSSQYIPLTTTNWVSYLHLLIIAYRLVCVPHPSSFRLSPMR